MKRTAILMAAALAVGGVGVVPAMAATKSAPPARMAGGNSPAAAYPGIVAGLTIDALTPNDMNHLVGQFAASVRQQVTASGTFSQGYGDKLDAQIRRFSADWKQKYGHEFDIKIASQSFAAPFATIDKQSIRHHAVTLLVKGPAGLPDLKVPVTYSEDSWRIDVPASLTAQEIRQNLQAQLSAMDKDVAHWPAREMDAYRRVGCRVLMAVLNEPLPAAHADAGYNGVPVAQASGHADGHVAVVSTASHHWWQFWN